MSNSYFKLYVSVFRQVAIIKIWNPEIENKILPTLFFFELFVETFQETKTSFPEKIYFHGIR